MGMKVDQAGNQDVFIQHLALVGKVALTRFAGRQDGENSAVVDGHGVVIEHGIRVDRGNPACFNQKVDFFRCCRHGKRVCPVWVAC